MNTLSEFQKCSAAQFEAWLTSGFRAHYGSDARAAYDAFDLRGLGISNRESSLETLSEFFKQLPDQAREQFRDSVERLLRHADPGDFPVDGLRDAVVLVGVVRATSALDAFVPVLGASAWGELHPDLFYYAIGSLLALDRSLVAYKVAKQLVKTRNFVPAYLFDVYTVMLRSRPEAWAADLTELSEFFARQAHEIERSQDQAQVSVLASRRAGLAHELLDALSIDQIADGIALLDVRPANGLSWLLAAFCSDGGPLAILANMDTGRWRLVDRAEPHRWSYLDAIPDALRVVVGDLQLLEWDVTAPVRIKNSDIERLVTVTC